MTTRMRKRVILVKFPVVRKRVVSRRDWKGLALRESAMSRYEKGLGVD